MKKKYLFDFVCLFCILTLSCFVHYKYFATVDNSTSNIAETNSNDTKTEIINIKPRNKNIKYKLPDLYVFSLSDVNFFIDDVKIDAYGCSCRYHNTNYVVDKVNAYYYDTYIYVEDLLKCGFELNYDSESNTLKINKSNNGIENTSFVNYESYLHYINNRKKISNSFYKDFNLRIFLDGVELTNSELKDFVCEDSYQKFGFLSNNEGTLISVDWIKRFYCNENNENEEDNKLYLDYDFAVCSSKEHIPPIKIRITEPLIEYGKKNWGNKVQNYLNNADMTTLREKIVNFNSFEMIVGFLPRPYFMDAYDGPHIDAYSEPIDKVGGKISDFKYSDKITVFSDGNKILGNFEIKKTEYVKSSIYLCACRYSFDGNKLSVDPKSFKHGFYMSNYASKERPDDFTETTSFSRSISCVDLKLYSNKKEIKPDDGMPTFLSIDGELYVKSKDIVKALKI